MFRAIYRFLIPYFCLALLAAPAGAGEVKISHNGRSLNANLNIAPGKSLSDGVVVLLHGTLAHKDMEIMRALQDLLVERGLNNLAFNLSLAQDDRHAMFDCAGPHRHLDGNAVTEIALWVAWLKEQGAGPITVLGHSRGGNQIARYIAGSPDGSVTGAVLVAPGTWRLGKQARGYAKRYEKDLAPLLARAEALVKAGKGDSLMRKVGFLYCPDTNVAAATFADHYRANPDRDTPSVVDRAKVPVLVVAASDDQVNPKIAARMKAHVSPNVRLEVIEAAGHFFRDLVGDDLADLIAEFVGASAS